jgi:hypothetical protein
MKSFFRIHKCPAFMANGWSAVTAGTVPGMNQPYAALYAKATPRMDGWWLRSGATCRTDDTGCPYVLPSAGHQVPPPVAVI